MGMTVSALLAMISETLESSGYQRISRSAGHAEAPATFRLFEDAYGIVGVALYETWLQLRQDWAESQGVMVNIMSAGLNDDDKAWEGYLVLATPGALDRSELLEVNNLRYDMGRVRKFVITGDDIRDISDVRGALQSILPIELPGLATAPTDILDILMDSIPTADDLRTHLGKVIAALRDGYPLLNALSDPEETR